MRNEVRETIFRGNRTEKDGLQDRKKGVDAAVETRRSEKEGDERGARGREGTMSGLENRVVRRERREKVEVCCAAVGTDCRE